MAKAKKGSHLHGPREKSAFQVIKNNANMNLLSKFWLRKDFYEKMPESCIIPWNKMLEEPGRHDPCAWADGISAPFFLALWFWTDCLNPLV